MPPKQSCSTCQVKQERLLVSSSDISQPVGGGPPKMAHVNVLLTIGTDVSRTNSLAMSLILTMLRSQP